MFGFPKFATLSLLLLWSSSTHQNSLSVDEVTPSTPQKLQEQYGDALEAIFGIGVRLEALLQDTAGAPSNFLISPLSIALIVGQLMLGAEGRFRDELYNLLSLPESDEKNTAIIYYSHKQKKNVSFPLPYAKLHVQMGALMKALEGKEISKAFTLNTSNALFVNNHLKLKREFRIHMQIYEALIQPLNFSTDPVGSQKFINDWAATQTNGAITTVLPAPLPVTASAVFMNAIYFLGEWETPFSYEANINGSFYSTKNRTVEVEYMRGFFENIPYGESKKLGCKMVGFPYKNNELAMYFVQPNVDEGNEYNITKFAKKLTAKDVLQCISELKNHSISLQIPKMKLSNTLSVLKPLQKYRAFMHKKTKTNETGDALDILEERLEEFESFNTTKDVNIYLKGAAENEKLKITNILQEMTLSVDEKGTEAAAVSLSIIDYIGGSKMLKLDRPFVFFIRHEITSAILFWGTIVNPTQSQ